MSKNRLDRQALVVFAIVFWNPVGRLSTCWGQQEPLEQKLVREAVGFDRIQPILRKRCQNCHNAEELRGDLSVSDMTAIFAGSSSGPVVVAGKPQESLLYTTAAHLDEPVMPPNSRRIPARELELIKQWIEGGLQKKSGDGEGEPMSAPPATDDASEESNLFEPVRGILQSTAFPAIALETSGKTLAVSGERQIALLDLETMSFEKALPFPAQDITQLAFSLDGERLFAGGGTAGLSGSVYVFDAQSAKQLFKIADETDSILALDIAPDHQTVAFGGPSKLLKICRISDGSIVRTMRKHTDWVMSAKFSPDGLLLASADRFGGVFVWEAESGELFHALSGHAGSVNDLVWDGDSETLLSAGEDGTIRVWNMHHGTLTAQWDGRVGAIMSLDRYGTSTVVGGRNGLVKAWGGPDDCIATFDAKQQVDHVRVDGLAKCIVADVSGAIHVLAMPSLAPVERVSMPLRPEARDELLDRLDRRLAQFKESFDDQDEPIFATDSSTMLIPSTVISENKALEMSQSDLIAEGLLERERRDLNQSTREKLVRSLELEVETAGNELAEQISEREQIKRRLHRLNRLLEEASADVASGERRLDRLKEMLELARSVFPSHDEE